MNMPLRPARRLSVSREDRHSRGPLSYLAMGSVDAPCVVLLHGFGADLLTWQFCLVPLSAHYRVVAIDLPGHGRSTPDVGDGTVDYFADWLAEGFGWLDIGAAHLVGHSMGGRIALSFARTYPALSRSLSLISAAGIGPLPGSEALSAFIGAQDMPRALNLAKSLIGEASPTLTPMLARSLLEAARDPDRRHALQTIMARGREFGLSQNPPIVDWTQLSPPVQFIWGAQDRLIPLPDPAHLPDDARLCVFEGVGHLPHMEAARAVNEALKEFLHECA